VGALDVGIDMLVVGVVWRVLFEYVVLLTTSGISRPIRVALKVETIEKQLFGASLERLKP